MEVKSLVTPEEFKIIETKNIVSIFLGMATIPRVKETPMVTKLFRGKTYTIPNPQPGSIVSICDNGYGNGVNYSAVVTEVKYGKDGIATVAFLSTIVSLTEDTVTYHGVTEKIKPYFNSQYARWDTHATHSLNFIVFDSYTKTTEGYFK